MRPIPRAFLIHSATLLAAAGTNEATAAPLAELSRIRVETEQTQTEDREETQARRTAQLWYDVRQSLPRNVQFVPGQLVLYQGERYRIVAVKELYCGRRLHHLEISLTD